MNDPSAALKTSPLGVLKASPLDALKTSPLDGLHRALGARMVGFAGYAMPVSYPAGILAEHRACREAAALFDVSHMGQAELAGPGAAAALERLVPGDITGLGPNRQRYTLLTNDAGGIEDDLMVARLGEDRLFLIVNAARKDADFARISAHLPPGVALSPRPERALLAFQGPGALAILAPLAPDLPALPFMAVAETRIAGIPTLVSRSGYTGEDGVEISLPADAAETLARRLLTLPGVLPAGLGARDLLRLEAGLCLYGQDIDEETSPIAANLAWTIAKRRRLAWDFPGGAAIRAELEAGPVSLRVGLRLEGRAPARGGAPILDAGEVIGRVTSGSFSPSLDAPIAIGYVAAAHARPGTKLAISVRERALPAVVTALPFIPHRYAK